MIDEQIWALDADQLQRLWELYVVDCLNRDEPPTMRYFSIWLGER